LMSKATGEDPDRLPVEEAGMDGRGTKTRVRRCWASCLTTPQILLDCKGNARYACLFVFYKFISHLPACTSILSFSYFKDSSSR
jgi:hypothetical protein